MICFRGIYTGLIKLIFFNEKKFNFVCSKLSTITVYILLIEILHTSRNIAVNRK